MWRFGVGSSRHLMCTPTIDKGDEIERFSRMRM